MGKISPVTAKYIVNATIEIEGVVDRPDVIGAIFGQTEGLLGNDLELRELQRSGRIGRIEVVMQNRTGKSVGTIIIPSSLDKAETSIVGAALEIIQRIGPCTATIKVQNIEDIRVAKRGFLVQRAKELLQQMMEQSLPDSQELADEVAHSVRVMEIREYGRERLPCGPSIEDADEVLVVEGRADVLNLLKHGFKNAVALNGTSVPKSIIDLCRKKTVIAFVDGDRGGDLILRELLGVAEVDFVTKAPDGKEVEEITKKEIHKSIRGKITAEQAQMELGQNTTKLKNSRPHFERHNRYKSVQKILSPDEKLKFRGMVEDLVGTRGGYLLDTGLNILGKVPISELGDTIRSLHTGIYAIIFDGSVNTSLLQAAEHAKIQHLIGMDAQVQANGSVNVMTAAEL